MHNVSISRVFFFYREIKIFSTLSYNFLLIIEIRITCLFSPGVKEGMLLDVVEEKRNHGKSPSAITFPKFSFERERVEFSCLFT